MRRQLVWPLFAFGALFGCSDGESDGQGGGQRPDAGEFRFDDGEPEARALELCTDDPSDEDALVALHGRVDDSVHELITCGGAQFNLMASLVPQIFASNEQLLHPDVRAYLPLVEPPFTSDGEGAWRMDPAPGTRFLVEFLPPGSEPDAAPVKGDLFRLEAYFSELAVVESPTPLALATSPRDMPHRFSMTFSGKGPLGDLLPPETFESGRLDLDLSSEDLLALFSYQGGDAPFPDVGPLAALLNLPIRSRVEVDDEERGVHYVARGPADEMSDLLRGQYVAFVFDTLTASSQGITLDGTAVDLEFESMGVLSGRIDYVASGDGVEGARVTSDFGQGASYPRNLWFCEEE